MKLLNSKSSIDCNEYEEKYHLNEIQTIYKNICKINNIDCALVITNSFENEPKIIKSKLHNILDDLAYFDIKNGVDVYQDEDFITFVLNGQIYKENNDYKIFNTFIKVLPLDVFGNPIKMYIDKLI